MVLQVGKVSPVAGIQNGETGNSEPQGQGVVFDMQWHVTPKRSEDFIAQLRKKFMVLPDPQQKCFAVH